MFSDRRQRGKNAVRHEHLGVSVLTPDISSIVAARPFEPPALPSTSAGDRDFGRILDSVSRDDQRAAPSRESNPSPRAESARPAAAKDKSDRPRNAEPNRASTAADNQAATRDSKEPAETTSTDDSAATADAGSSDDACRNEDHREAAPPAADATAPATVPAPPPATPTEAQATVVPTIMLADASGTATEPTDQPGLAGVDAAGAAAPTRQPHAATPVLPDTANERAGEAIAAAPSRQPREVPPGQTTGGTDSAVEPPVDAPAMPRANTRDTAQAAAPAAPQPAAGNAPAATAAQTAAAVTTAAETAPKPIQPNGPAPERPAAAARPTGITIAAAQDAGGNGRAPLFAPDATTLAAVQAAGNAPVATTTPTPAGDAAVALPASDIADLAIAGAASTVPAAVSTPTADTPSLPGARPNGARPTGLPQAGAEPTNANAGPSAASGNGAAAAARATTPASAETFADALRGTSPSIDSDDGAAAAAPVPAPASDPTTVPFADPARSAQAQADPVHAARLARAAAAPVAAQVAIHLSKAVGDGVDRINIQLSPVELGRIDVRLDIGNDGHVMAVFNVDRPQTADLLQRDARELTRALQDSGLKTDSGSLSFNLRDQNRDQSPRFGFAAERAETTSDTGERPAALARYAAPGAANGRLDIRV